MDFILKAIIIIDNEEGGGRRGGREMKEGVERSGELI